MTSSAVPKIVQQDAQWTSWSQTLDGLTGQLMDLLDRKRIWIDYQDLVRASPHANRPSAFHDWVNSNYAEAQAAAVRRLVDRRRGNLSLRRFLEELATHAAGITFERYRSLWKDLPGPPEAAAKFARNAFAKFSKDGASVDAAMIRADRDDLLQAAEGLDRYASQYVAHRSQEPDPAVTPTYLKLHLALDVAGSLVAKYHLLLTASTWPHGLEPIPQENWQDLFLRAWIDGRHRLMLGL